MESISHASSAKQFCKHDWLSLMNRLMVLFVSLGGLFFGILAQAQSLSGEARAEQVAQQLLGTKAPALELHRLDGGTLDLGSLYGKKPIYLKFWASWCQPCMEQMRHFQSVQAQAHGDMVVIGINLGMSDTLQDVQRVRERYGLTMPLVIDDGSAAAAFHVRVSPLHVIIGRDGRIQHVGHLVNDSLAKALHEAQRAAPADTLNAHNGKPTVVTFLATWCESYLAGTRPAVAQQCKARLEQLAAAKARYGADFNWQWVATGLWTTPEDLREFATQSGMAGLVGLGAAVRLDETGELFERFAVHDYPTVLILDRDGAVRARLLPSDDLQLALEHNLPQASR